MMLPCAVTRHSTEALRLSPARSCSSRHLPLRRLAVSPACERTSATPGGVRPLREGVADQGLGATRLLRHRSVRPPPRPRPLSRAGRPSAATASAIATARRAAPTSSSLPRARAFASRDRTTNASTATARPSVGRKRRRPFSPLCRLSTAKDASGDEMNEGEIAPRQHVEAPADTAEGFQLAEQARDSGPLLVETPVGHVRAGAARMGRETPGSALPRR